METDQIDRVLNKFDDIIDDDAQNLPQMPFPSSYVLTREEEDDLVDYALQRLDDLDDQMGRRFTKNGDWFDRDLGLDVDGDDGKHVAPERTFMGKRRLYELIYQNNMDWRQSVIGGIFEHSNLVVPVARRIARQMTARGNNYFFGSDPWFAAYPVGAEDRELAIKANKYTRHKAEEAGLRGCLETAVNKAFVLGEQVVKTTHSVKEQPYQRLDTILINIDGDPIFGEDGDYITDEDRFDESGILLRDGKTQLPDEPIFEERLISRRLREYYGPATEGIPFQDFLCPLDAVTIQDADCCAHLYDQPAMELVDMWAKRGAIDLNMTQEETVTAKAIEVLRKITSNDGEEHSDSQRSALGETQEGDKKFTGMVEIAEIYIRYDANGDGILEEILLMVDRKNRVPIFYDYVANVTPDGLRPFSVVKINKELGYWHGQGAIEMFESSQKIIDLLINRWEFAQTKAARVDFFRPDLTEEGRANPHLVLNNGQTYTPIPGVSAEEILTSVNLYDVKGDDTHSLLQFFLQLTMTESGVNSANDNSMAGLDSQKLATGIRNVEKSGQEMFSVYISDLEPGIASVLDKFKNTLFDEIDRDEVITFFEGEAREIVSIASNDIADLDLHMSMVMTRQHGEEILESNRQASELVTIYYSLEPTVQFHVMKFYQDMLRTLKIKNPEQIIVPLGQPSMNADPGPGSQLDAQAPDPAQRQATPNL